MEKKGRLTNELESTICFFKDIIEVAQLAIWEYDMVSKRTVWSGDVQHFFNPSILDNLSIEKAYGLFSPKDRSKAIKAFEKALRWRVKWDLDAQLSYHNININKEYIWIRHVGYPVLDGSNVVKLRGLLMDIDERKRNEVELQKKHKEVLKYQSMLMNTQINPHFIFNALNSIQYYILKNDTAAAVDFIADFSSLMRGVLENSMVNRVDLKGEIEWLEKYLQVEQKRFEKKFDYSINIDESVDVEDITIPTMILQPFVENAILHGISSMTSGGKIDISFKKVKSKVFCTIEDNGVGRKKSEKMKVSNIQKHKSYGMHITQKKLEVLSQIEDGNFQYNVIDKLDEKGHAAGTKVVIAFEALLPD